MSRRDGGVQLLVLPLHRASFTIGKRADRVVYCRMVARVYSWLLSYYCRMALEQEFVGGAEAEAEAAEQTARRGDANNCGSSCWGRKELAVWGLENWRAVWHVKGKLEEGIGRRN